MIRGEDDAKLQGVFKIRRKSAMSTQERGVYQPQDDFASYEDYPEEEGRSRLPLMIVIALVVVAAFGGVVWLAYNQGVAHGRAGAPPIVAAPAGPARTAPDESQTASGTPHTPYTGLKIYGEPVPPDEEAASSALAPQSSPEVTETALAEPTPAAPPPAQPAQDSSLPEIVVATPEPSAPQAAVSVATQPQRGRPVPPASAPAPAPTPLAPTTAAPAPTPLAPATAAPVRTTPEVATAPPPQPAPPPVQVATAEPPAAAARGSAAISGKAVLQIGSFPSAALADAAWTRFQRSHAGAVGGLSPDVKPVQIPGKGTWYRLRIGPFADRGAANTKCAQLKAQGATCLVGTP